MAALECHEELIYFVPHKLTNGRRLGVSSVQALQSERRTTRRMRNALMRRVLLFFCVYVCVFWPAAPCCNYANFLMGVKIVFERNTCPSRGNAVSHLSEPSLTVANSI